MMGNQMAFPRRRRQRRVQGIGGKKLECGGEFTALTSAIFDSKKMPVCERIEFPLHLFEFHSLKACASDGRNAETTGRYCLSKVFAAPESEEESAKRGSGDKAILKAYGKRIAECSTLVHDGENGHNAVIDASPSKARSTQATKPTE